MRAYYNDNNPTNAEWLRALMSEGLLPDGEIDDRSIANVSPADLAGFDRCHFFAGIGGWQYALDLARWPDDRPVWTGSCPCQPFSVAGKGGGADDERHLWPELQRLISECRPSIALGEQVASKAGREWWWDVQTDLEGMGYAGASSDLCAASIGAPHIRQRLFFGAVALEPGGLGDSFGAGFLAALCTGATLPDAASSAMQLAAQVIQSRGALVPAIFEGERP